MEADSSEISQVLNRLREPVQEMPPGYAETFPVRMLALAKQQGPPVIGLNHSVSDPVNSGSERWRWPMLACFAASVVIAVWLDVSHIATPTGNNLPVTLSPDMQVLAEWNQTETLLAYAPESPETELQIQATDIEVWMLEEE